MPIFTAGRGNETDNIHTISYNDGYYHITIKMNKEHKNRKKDNKKIGPRLRTWEKKPTSSQSYSKIQV
jgi:hypothetical protein